MNYDLYCVSSEQNISDFFFVFCKNACLVLDNVITWYKSTKDIPCEQFLYN